MSDELNKAGTMSPGWISIRQSEYDALRAALERLRGVLEEITKEHMTQDGLADDEVRARRQLADITLRPLGTTNVALAPQVAKR